MCTSVPLNLKNYLALFLYECSMQIKTPKLTLGMRNLIKLTMMIISNINGVTVSFLLTLDMFLFNNLSKKVLMLPTQWKNICPKFSITTKSNYSNKNTIWVEYCNDFLRVNIKGPWTISTMLFRCIYCQIPWTCFYLLISKKDTFQLARSIQLTKYLIKVRN